MGLPPGSQRVSQGSATDAAVAVLSAWRHDLGALVGVEQSDDPGGEEDYEPPPEVKLMHDGWSAQLAQNRNFENVTLAVISFNAIWLGVDLELNEASTWMEADPIFKVADNFFCMFFSFEVLVRFMAFKRKGDFWRSRSFVFDLLLVAMMVFEVWVVAIVTAFSDAEGGGGFSNFMANLSVLRLLRLLRLTRMARLMRAFPELMTLIKGLIAALRNVATMFLLQVGIMWVFGIIFTQSYRTRKCPDCINEAQEAAYAELHELYFNKMGVSMVTLFVQGTLLDNLATVALSLWHHNLFMMFVFFLFVLISSLTLLNMLIGVLTTVVANTTVAEKTSALIFSATSKLRGVFDIADQDGNDTISRAEFSRMLLDPLSPMREAFALLGIPEDRMNELGTHVFGDCRDANSCEELTFERFMDELLKLRPGDAVSVRDVTSLRRCASTQLESVGRCVAAVDERIKQMRGEQDAALSDGGAAARATAQRARLREVPTQVIMDELGKRLGYVAPRPAA